MTSVAPPSLINRFHFLSLLPWLTECKLEDVPVLFRGYACFFLSPSIRLFHQKVKEQDRLLYFSPDQSSTRDSTQFKLSVYRSQPDPKTFFCWLQFQFDNGPYFVADVRQLNSIFEPDDSAPVTFIDLDFGTTVMRLYGNSDEEDGMDDNAVGGGESLNNTNNSRLETERKLKQLAKELLDMKADPALTSWPHVVSSSHRATGVHNSLQLVSQGREAWLQYMEALRAFAGQLGGGVSATLPSPSSVDAGVAPGPVAEAMWRVVVGPALPKMQASVDERLRLNEKRLAEWQNNLVRLQESGELTVDNAESRSFADQGEQLLKKCQEAREDVVELSTLIMFLKEVGAKGRSQ